MKMIIKYKRQPETTLPIQSTLPLQSFLSIRPPFAAVYPIDIHIPKKAVCRLQTFTFPIKKSFSSNFLLWFSRIYIKTKTFSFLLGPSVYRSIYSQFFFFWVLSVLKKKILAAILGTKISISPPLFFWFYSRSRQGIFPRLLFSFCHSFDGVFYHIACSFFFLCHP